MIRLLLILAASSLLLSAGDRSKKPVLKFKPYKKISYQYKQYVESSMWGNDQLINSTDMIVEGTIDIIISENDSAYVQFHAADAWQVSTDRKGKKDSTKLDIPPSNFGHIYNDGKFDRDTPPEANDFSVLLFPLPSSALKKGRVETTEMPMTFSTLNEPLKIKGKKTLKLDKTSRKGKDRIYTSILSVLAIEGDENKVTPEMPAVWYDADATYEFNNSRGYFEKGDIAISLGFIAESSEGSPFGKGKLKMTMKSTINYKLRNAEKK